MDLLKLSLVLSNYCGTNCTCVSNCTAVCSHVCESVASCAANWSVAGTPKLTASFWAALKSAVDSWLSNWGYGSSPAAVSAGARVLASDWNVKIRDPLNQNTQNYPGLATFSLGVATAVAGTGTGTSGVRSADAVNKMNTRKCTTVYGSRVYAVCICNEYNFCTCDMG